MRYCDIRNLADAGGHGKGIVREVMRLRRRRETLTTYCGLSSNILVYYSSRRNKKNSKVEVIRFEGSKTCFLLSKIFPAQ